MTEAGVWRAALHTVRGASQVWATVADGQLLAALVDWDRENEVASLGRLLAAAAARAAASGPADLFPGRCLRELYDVLTGPARPPMVDGVSAAAVAAGPVRARAAWAGDVRVQVESAGGTWSSRDHTLANRADATGVALDHLDISRIVYKVVGRLNPFYVEKHEERAATRSPIRRVALASPDLHGYAPLDVGAWTSLAAPRPAKLPLDAIAEGALFTLS